uniref:SUN domain-containing protein n=1 Tax=Meleagris gallopavo TaxID=9103 RepID=A0A803YSE8_MELGA
MVSAGLVVHKLLSLGNSPVWLEGKRQELNVETTQLLAMKDFILQSVFDALQENGIHGLKREKILQLTQHTIEKVMENSIWMPNWALETIGATVDAERTSKSYGGKGWKNHQLSPLFSTAEPPETHLHPDISPGNCWAFQGSQGHVVIRLLEKIQPMAFTIWHISKVVSPSREVSSAPKEFAVLVSLCLLLLLECPKEKLCHRAPQDPTEPPQSPIRPHSRGSSQKAVVGYCRAQHPAQGHGDPWCAYMSPEASAALRCRAAGSNCSTCPDSGSPFFVLQSCQS